MKKKRTLSITISSLEPQPKTELDLPRRIVLTQDDFPKRGRRDAIRRTGENHLIRRIAEFGAEGELNALGDRGEFFNRCIQIEQSGIVDVWQIAAHISESKLRSLRKRRRIEVRAAIANLWSAWQRIRDSGRIGPHTGAAAERVGIIRRRNRHRTSGIRRVKRADRPSPKRLRGRPGFQQALAWTERQLISHRKPRGEWLVLVRKRAVAHETVVVLEPVFRSRDAGHLAKTSSAFSFNNLGNPNITC